MPWYLTIALRQLFPSGRIFSFFGVLSVVGVMLGVSVLLIVQSVMSGFGDKLRSSIASSNGDIRVQSGRPIEAWRPLLADLQKVPAVEAAEPFLQGVVLMQYDERPSFPGILGLDPILGGSVFPLEEYLLPGSLETLDDESIFVGVSLAESLNLQLGSFVEIYTPLLLNRLQEDEILLPREMRVVGIFRSGWEEVDRNLILTSLSVMQDLYGFGDAVGGIMLKVEDRDRAPEVAFEINKTLPLPLEAITWLELNRDFLFVLQLEKSMMAFIMLFILIVAAFSISISLMTSVVQKTREIGLYAAMGASRFEVALAFCLQGLVIGLVGSVLGVLLAWTALENRGVIIETFTRLTQSEAALRTYYMFSEIPASYNASDFAFILGFSVFVSTLGGLIPAIRAGLLDPAEALRSE
ncbi:MAG: ABC transporter permease [Puniceicoccaceae bacterium]